VRKRPEGNADEGDKHDAHARPQGGTQASQRLPSQSVNAGCWQRRSCKIDAVGLDRPRYVLDLLGAQVLEGEIEFVEDLVPDHLADIYLTGLG